MSEFDLIKQHFTRTTRHTNLSVGDDAALIAVSEGMELAVSADMLVAGTHFFADTDPYQLGWKALAVNVSDMAAMGANPKWSTLTIALPHNDTAWLTQFSNGFFACAEAFDIDLIGGDTTRTKHENGLTLSVQIMGEVPVGRAIRRSGAQVGDDIWVSGELGKAAAALAHLLGSQHIPDTELTDHLDALHMPQPRIALGLALRDIATSCLDISDGLLADLGHILKASNVGADIHLQNILTSKFITSNLDKTEFQQYVLAGGDDYELCFTASPNDEGYLLNLSKNLNLPLSKIGKITSSLGLNSLSLNVFDTNNQIIELANTGYNHFN